MIIFTGGKTGGHITPLINLIYYLNRKAEYVGYKGNIEENICKDNSISFIGMIDYKNKFKNIFSNYWHLCKLYKKKDIEMIISTGGYVSIPMLIYGVSHRIPIVLYEENVIMGKTIKAFEPFSKVVLLAHPLEKNKKKYKYVGLPVKKFKKQVEKEIDILIIGGSLGSKPLCEVAVNLSKYYKVLLIAGKYKNEINDTSMLKVIDFSNDIYELIQKSRCVISRAGAMTTYEVMYMNVPLIVIPSENTVLNHQVLNAKYFYSIGVCEIFRENDDLEKLKKIIDDLLHNINKKIDMIHNQRKYIIDDSEERIETIINEF